MYRDLFSLNGKIAAVVGGGGVLAGEMAMGLAHAGADICIVDFNGEAAENRAEAVRGLGRRALAVQADGSKKQDLQRALDSIVATFGHVDILINAAGINSGTPFFEISEDEWHRILDVDLKSVSLAARSSAKRWWMRGAGIDHQHLFGLLWSAPFARLHLQRRQRRREPDHSVPGSGMGPPTGSRKCHCSRFFPAEQNS